MTDNKETKQDSKPTAPPKSGHPKSQCQKFDEQIVHGLYVVKRCGAYVRKFIDAQKSLVEQLEKTTKREKTKESGLRKDAVGSFVGSVISLQTVVTATIHRHQDFVARATKEVLSPLQEFYVSGEKQRVVINKKESKQRDALDKHLHNLISLRKDCMSLHTELHALKKSRDADEPASPRQQKTDIKIKEKAKKANKYFASFEKSLIDVAGEVKQYYGVTMLELLQEYEKLELERLKCLKTALTTFAAIYAENLPMDQPAEIKASFDNLNVETDINALKESLLQSAPPPTLPDTLPCKAVDFNSDAWLNPGSVSGGIASPPGSPMSSPLKQRDPDEMSTTGAGSIVDASSKDSLVVPESEFKEAPQSIRNSVAGIQDHARPEAVTVAGVHDTALFCRGLYDFSTEHPADLKFRVNDVIRVLTPAVDPTTLDPSNPQWLMGEVLSQEKNVMATGSFPSNYVEFFPGADLDSYLLNVQPFF